MSFPPPADAVSPAKMVALGAAGPFPGENPALMNTSMKRAAVEVDDIPDIYKLRRGGGTKAPWILGIVLLSALVAAAVATSILAGEDSSVADNGNARIDIVSMPEGGTVFINNEPLDQKTPAVFRGAVNGKKYVVAVEIDKHQRWESEVVVPAGEDRVKVIATMEPLTVKLTVESSPSDAEVFLNGKSYGRTPLSLPDLAPSTATELVLKRRNYLPVKRKLDWSAEREKSLSFELKKF